MSGDSKNTVSIITIMSKFKSKRHFHEAYTAQGKLLVDSQYLSWNYIAEVLTGKKLLISTGQLKDFCLPPRW